MGCNESKEKLGEEKSSAPAPAESSVKNSGSAKKHSASPNLTVGSSGSKIASRHSASGGFSSLIIESDGRLTDRYDVSSGMLGEGSFGTVKLARRKADQVEVAVKVISKAKMKSTELFRREIAIMRAMDHPNIIKLYEIFEDKKRLYLVMEVATGGELFDRIVQAKKFTEKQAAGVVKQILRALFYMHANHICHRDLKPENFLLSGKGPIEECTLKVIDFGLSIPFEEGKKLKSRAGTPFYVAPEVLSGSYNEKSDLWSVGAIMFVLLCGYPPFGGKDDKAVMDKVKTGDYAFKPKYWDAVSKAAKTLITKLLEMNPKKRLGAEEALADPWVAREAPEASYEPLSNGLIDNMKSFKANNRLKKVALGIIAKEMNEAKISELRNLFISLDDNGDGMLTKEELTSSIRQSGLKVPDGFQDIIDNIDADGNGFVEYTEFLSAALDKRSYLEEDLLWTSFAFFDRDGDGKISIDELRLVLKDDGVQGVLGGQTAEEIMLSIDTSGDGGIDFDEFMTMMKESPGKKAGATK